MQGKVGWGWEGSGPGTMGLICKKSYRFGK
jgi:hypothetical protein